MDWMGIVNAQVMWKMRLQKLLAGTSEETLDPAVVDVDNRCASGQCIYGDGQAYREAETYEEVRLMHADFLKLTAEAVSLPMAGKADEAKELLNGNYARLSERLKRHILGLSQQTNK